MRIGKGDWVEELSVVGNQLPAIGGQLSAIRSQLSVVGCLLGQWARMGGSPKDCIENKRKNIFMPMKFIMLLLLTGLFCRLPANGQTQESGYGKPVAPVTPLDKQRVQEIAGMLAAEPRGLGDTYKDRKTWDALKATRRYDRLLAQAGSLLQQEYPEWDEATYMRMFTHGDSQSGKDLQNAHLKWVIVLTWAECLENKGRFVAKIETVIEALLGMKTWVYPRNYNERNYRGLVELSTASYAHNLAQVRYLLDDKLKPATRDRIVEALRKRAFNPVLATLAGENSDHGWLKSTNNWNAVCLSGVTGAALAVLSDKTERAQFVAMAERYHQNFIAGFLSDGYCTEGIGYYNYGFGRFITLRESVVQATRGKLDFFDHPKMEKIAAFGPNSEIMNDNYPAIADCRTGAKPAKNTMYYLSRTMGTGGSRYDTLTFEGASADLVADVMYVFPNSSTLLKTAGGNRSEQLPVRSYFDVAGILTVRPASSSGKLAAVLKGGRNDEHHNHNDLGSYTLVVGDEIMVGDPGLIPYTAKTFGPERYSYKTLASYGHPVPLLGGMQQRAGAEAQAKVVKADFTPTKDTFMLELTSAYALPALTSCTREFVYERGAEETLTVIDKATFSEPQQFETALITRCQWKKLGSNQLLLEGKNQQTVVTIQSDNAGFSIESETISEENGEPYTRIALRSDRPVINGKWVVSYAPYAQKE